MQHIFLYWQSTETVFVQQNTVKPAICVIGMTERCLVRSCLIINRIYISIWCNFFNLFLYLSTLTGVYVCASVVL